MTRARYQAPGLGFTLPYAPGIPERQQGVCWFLNAYLMVQKLSCSLYYTRFDSGSRSHCAAQRRTSQRVLFPVSKRGVLESINPPPCPAERSKRIVCSHLHLRFRVFLSSFEGVTFTTSAVLFTLSSYYTVRCRPRRQYCVLHFPYLVARRQEYVEVLLNSTIFYRG